MERLEQCKIRITEYIRQLQLDQYPSVHVEIPKPLWPFMDGKKMFARMRAKFTDVQIAQPERSWLDERQEEICLFVAQGPPESVRTGFSCISLCFKGEATGSRFGRNATKLLLHHCVNPY